MQYDENSAGGVHRTTVLRNLQGNSAGGKEKGHCWGTNNTTPLGEDKATRWGVVKQLAIDKGKLLGDIPIKPQKLRWGR